MSDLDESQEKQFIGNIVKNQTKYGTIRSNPMKGTRFIIHRLQNDGTLQGIALRYNVTVSINSVEFQVSACLIVSLFVWRFLFLFGDKMLVVLVLKSRKLQYPYYWRLLNGNAN